MSPGLRSEAARYSLTLFNNVPWCREAADGFLTNLALSMTPALYTATELVSGVELHIVVKGVVISVGACI